MSALIASAWFDVVVDKPRDVATAAVIMALAAIVAGLALRGLTRRTRSVRHLVLAITLCGLAIGAVAAALLVRLMVLESSELSAVIVVLAATSVFAVVLAVVASAPLGRDAQRLAAMVRRLHDGDRSVRSGVARSDELGAVASALDELTARLDALERERENFEHERRMMLSSIGHDLRTPLTALRVAIEALADGVTRDPDRYLRAMSRDVEVLSALVEDVFLLARIESGALHIPSQPVDLTELADEAIEALSPTAAQRGVALRLVATGGVVTTGSTAAIGRVIRNLLDNAIRHAPADSIVQVVVDDDPEPTVRVVDEGPGFPPDFSTRAFDRFARADESRARATGGAGLGLAIARGLVEAHGGRIWIEPAPGGSVAFVLPAA